MMDTRKDAQQRGFCNASAVIGRRCAALLWAALLVVFFDIKSRREEAWLAARFPAYADYRRRVRKLIPFIY